MTTISVLVPTFRRPTDLTRCLNALSAQTRPADEVVVVVRDTDQETWQVVQNYPASTLALRAVSVTEPGTIVAMRRGLAETQGDIVALTDDDAAPRPDWLTRLEARFAADERVGGVGGRDWLHYENGTEEHGTHPTVGQVQWHGRFIGNHHLGVGAAREVDALKGVNSAYRGPELRAIGFDARMRGTGTVLHWELMLGLTFKKQGWKLIYDPAIGVEHFIAQRFGDSPRSDFAPLAVTQSVHNETLSALEYLPPLRRAAYQTWAFLVGTAGNLGLLQTLRFLARRDPNAFARLRAAAEGRRAARQTLRQGRHKPE